MIRFLPFAAILALAVPALGGYDFGNGGMVIRCGSADGPPAALLDVHEGSRRGATYRHLGSVRGQPLERAFARILRSHFGRAPEIERLFAEWFARRSTEIEFVRGPVHSPRNPGSIEAPVGCRRVQAAAQRIRHPVTPGAPQEIRIDREIWNALPTDQRAALLVHEYMIRWNYFVDSTRPREVIGQVSYLLSDRALADDDARWFLAFANGARQ